MNVKNLISMANQIASFYETMPNREKALADISNHIKKYWAVRMRRELLEYIDSKQKSDLKPIVIESIQLDHQKG